MHHTDLFYTTVTSLDTALKKDDNYCWQMFLKECDTLKKIVRYINDNLSDFYFSDESDEE